MTALVLAAAHAAAGVTAQGVADWVFEILILLALAGVVIALATDLPAARPASLKGI